MSANSSTRGGLPVVVGPRHAHRLLVAQIAALHIAVEPYMRVWLHHVAQPAHATERQDEVVEAIRTGDAEHAEAVMRDHVLRTAPRLAEFLRSRNQAAGMSSTRSVSAQI